MVNGGLATSVCAGRDSPEPFFGGKTVAKKKKAAKKAPKKAAKKKGAKKAAKKKTAKKG